MPSYEWYRFKQRALCGFWIIVTGIIVASTLFQPWPWWMRAIGTVAGLTMILLLAFDWTDDRQEHRALEDYRAAMDRWRLSNRRSVR